ncbi:hypothetical protein SteCoe_12737 [Stentor coeruleus]|uniref:DUF4201 domain-containing protein n=1 Tax=Stentor coeruleus TaxID=5963 RepID=A0A1R2CA01_9CILI|nr:hypothetical protein SteCoe_12737 [Stentor coeruleus]
MSEEDPISQNPEDKVKSPVEEKHSGNESSPDDVKKLEEEIIKLAEEDNKNNEKVNDEAEENPAPAEDEQELLADEEVKAEEEENSFDREKAEENAEIEGEVEAEEDESRILKMYQNTLQELKENISKLNRQLEMKSKQTRPDPTEEELFKLQTLCRLTKIEAKNLRTVGEGLAESNQNLADNLENLKQESASKVVSSEKIESLKSKLSSLEKEYAELSKPNEINIQNLEKFLSPDTPLKFINEFYVNVQKRIDQLETENTSLTASNKKSSIELAKLKEKLENSTLRHKQNEEIKAKLKALEDTYQNYISTEARICDAMKEASEEYLFYSAKPENQHDADSAQNILKDMRNQVIKEENEIENLEFVLQEKRNLLRAAQVYGLQRSKTSTKLRTDMELLGLVLVEKEQAISRLRKEIDEFRIKYNQVQIDIKEVIEKKNKELQSVKAN